MLPLFATSITVTLTFRILSGKALCSELILTSLPSNIHQHQFLQSLSQEILLSSCLSVVNDHEGGREEVAKCVTPDT